MTTAAMPSAGWQAIYNWSRRIHGTERHQWAVDCAELLDRHGPDAVLPPFPSPFPSTRAGRAETVRRLWRQAMAVDPEPDLFTAGGDPR